MAPIHACDLLFLVLLLLRLDDTIAWRWAAIVAPLWCTDALFLALKARFVSFRFVSRDAALAPRVPC